MFLLERVISFVAPHLCLGCADEGSLVCAWCAPDFCMPVPSRCFLCRRATPGSAVCEKCKPKTALRHAWVRSELTGDAQKLLYKFKFERAQSAAMEISSFMSEALPYAQNVLMIPMPPATSRMRQRGYDHTRLLAREIAQQKGMEWAGVLSRIGQSRQVGTRREQRLKQLTDAFWVSRPELVRGRHVWVVDDVVTTGATLNEAARTLKKAGAKTVDAVVFAQK